MKITGLHHLTAVSGNIQQTVQFYETLLGFRLIKQTVNFDAPESYHLYFGDRTGSPGTIITFFEWPQAPKGAPGIGGTHHIALRTSDRETLLKWKRRLTDANVKVRGPLNHGTFQSIYFRDPDGMNLEISTEGPGWKGDEPSPEQVDARSGESWGEPVPEITADMSLHRGMHHLTLFSSDLKRSEAFYGGLLDLKLVHQAKSHEDFETPHWFWGAGAGEPGTLVSAFEHKPSEVRKARMGRGMTHHFAFGVADEEEQLKWKERFEKAGWPVSPVRDRIYFKSIYSQDPDGHIVELATAGPGFLIDENEETLGTELKLPPWLEQYRNSIDQNLKPIREEA